VWLELIVHPTSSLIFEADPAAPELMLRPPRPRGEGPLRRGDWLRPVVLGLTLAVTVVVVYMVGLAQGMHADVARATAMIVMLVGQTTLVFVQRSPHRPVWRGPIPTSMAWWLVGATLISLVLAVTWPPLGVLLHLEEPAPLVALGAAAAGVLSTLWLEPFKR
jgi:Ca2+-transporting ATPase